jgi:hypothetical protein
MSDCCAPAESKVSKPHKVRCPVDGKECAEVSARTIAYHIRDAWKWKFQAGRYFFCNDPACPVVYFGDDGTIIQQSQLRTHVGVKSSLDDDLVCYCFGVSRANALNDSSIRDYVVVQTKSKLCSCDTCNPSGRCCLKDFPVHGKAE